MEQSKDNRAISMTSVNSGKEREVAPYIHYYLLIYTKPYRPCRPMAAYRIYPNGSGCMYPATHRVR